MADPVYCLDCNVELVAMAHISQLRCTPCESKRRDAAKLTTLNDIIALEEENEKLKNENEALFAELRFVTVDRDDWRNRYLDATGEKGC